MLYAEFERKLRHRRVIIGRMSLGGRSFTVAILQSQLEAFARGDVDAVIEHFAENCVLTVMIDGLPLHGRDAVRDYLEELDRVIAVSAVRVTSIAASDADVVAEVALRGRWLSDPPDGAELKRVRACIWTALEDGRIREQRVYVDRRRCNVQRHSTRSG